jgi:integrase
VLLDRTGLRIGEALGLRWHDLRLDSIPPRLTVWEQLDRWSDLVDAKTRLTPPDPAAPRCDRTPRTLARTAEAMGRAAGSQRERHRGLVFTTRTGKPIVRVGWLYIRGAPVRHCSHAPR